MKAILISLLFVACSCKVKDDYFDVVTHYQKWTKCYGRDYTDKVASNLDVEWYKEQSKKGWYYVLANKWHVISLTKALTGKAPIGKNSIKGACFATKSTSAGFDLTGFGKKAEFSCDAEPNGGRRECMPTPGSHNEIWAANRGSSEATIVWTDNTKYALGFRCNGIFRVWSVRSAENENIDEATRKKVMAFMKKEGSSPDNAVLIEREGCSAEAEE